jgi:hypothetical protein
MVQCTDSQTNSVNVTHRKLTLQTQKQCYPENGTSSLQSTETLANLYQTTRRQIPENVTYYLLMYIFSDSDIIHSNKGMLQVVFKFRVHM